MGKQYVETFKEKIMTDKRWRTVFFAGCSLLINIAYACYNAYLGIANRAAWFITMSFYYILLGVMRYGAVRTEFKISKNMISDQRKMEYRLMRSNGIILLFLILALSGTIVLTCKQKHIIAYDTITMITIATYTFYKITMAITNVIKVRKNDSPLLTTIRNIGLADAAMSILPMQTSMIASFQKTSDGYMEMMTIFTGTGICILLMFLGVQMIFPKHRKNAYSK